MSEKILVFWNKNFRADKLILNEGPSKRILSQMGIEKGWCLAFDIDELMGTEL
jgi:hypothetical protein